MNDSFWAGFEKQAEAGRNKMTPEEREKTNRAHLAAGAFSLGLGGASGVLAHRMAHMEGQKGFPKKMFKGLSVASPLIGALAAGSHFINVQRAEKKD